MSVSTLTDLRTEAAALDALLAPYGDSQDVDVARGTILRVLDKLAELDEAKQAARDTQNAWQALRDDAPELVATQRESDHLAALARVDGLRRQIGGR